MPASKITVFSPNGSHTVTNATEGSAVCTPVNQPTLGSPTRLRR